MDENRVPLASAFGLNDIQSLRGKFDGSADVAGLGDSDVMRNGGRDSPHRRRKVRWILRREREGDGFGIAVSVRVEVEGNACRCVSSRDGESVGGPVGGGIREERHLVLARARARDCNHEIQSALGRGVGEFDFNVRAGRAFEDGYRRVVRELHGVVIRGNGDGVPCPGGINVEFRGETAVGGGNLQNDSLVAFDLAVGKNGNVDHVSRARDDEGCGNGEVDSFVRTACVFDDTDVDVEGGVRHLGNRNGNANRRIVLVLDRVRIRRCKAYRRNVIVEECDIVRHGADAPSGRQRSFGKAKGEGLVGFGVRVADGRNNQGGQGTLRWQNPGVAGDLAHACRDGETVIIAC